ncbi:MAG: AAA family ATPase, partial [Deltaproteobacteria bacterium]
LFDGQARLASTSFSNHFALKDAQENRSKGTTSRLYSRMLNEAIKLGGSDFLPHITKLELRGQGGASRAIDLIESDRFHQRMGRHVQKIAGVALSHGYQSTFAWIADLIGHVLLESKAALSTIDMEGLVLLDEIDLYLHPSWQATFVTALRRVFPKIQFIATTHSPVILAGLAPHEVVRLQIDPESGDVVRAGWDPNTGQLTTMNGHNWPQPDPRPMTGSEIYNTWFGVDRLTPNPHGETLRRYLVLAEDPFRTDREHSELLRLRKQLLASGVGEFQDPVSRRSR